MLRFHGNRLEILLFLVMLVSMICLAASSQYSIIIPSDGSITYPSATRTFGIIANPGENPAIRNFYWLFGNQSIDYQVLQASQILRPADVDHFMGLVVWTKLGGYNTTAVQEFARQRIVISDIRDFCNIIYPSLSKSLQAVNTSLVTYDVDWGVFRRGDVVEMRNETGGVNRINTVLTSGLTTFGNITTIAHYDPSHIALLHMNGTKENSGFYVMDFDITTPETEWPGIWHVFPAVKLVKDFPAGKYARWFANGVDWPNVNWVYSWMTNFSLAHNNIVRIQSIGNSVNGKPINAFFIGSGARYAIIDGSMHGNEKSTTFSCLRLAEIIVEDWDQGDYWRRKLAEYTIIIIPILNPDGFTANVRGNANGVDLNRQFPPGATTTEPEAWALRSLMDNCTPTIYINYHEGRQWYPLNIYRGNHEANQFESFTIKTQFLANNTFTELKHWGYYTDDGTNIWIGKVATISKAGRDTMANAYASWKFNTSCTLLETFVWSSDYNGTNYKARQGLWATDCYVCVGLASLGHYDRIPGSNYTAYSTSQIELFELNTQLTLKLGNAEPGTSSLTEIYVGEKGKPLTVIIDGVQKTEGDGWTYNSSMVGVTGVQTRIDITW